jgi:4-hydroxy-tetrahydrodipicolinate synthase
MPRPACPLKAVALKECDRDLAVISTKISAVGDRIAIMSGDDDLGFPTFLMGSPGGIFMTANLVPAFHRKLFEATIRSDLATARNAHYALLPLVEALYTADHPGPLKDAMALSDILSVRPVLLCKGRARRS